MNLKEWLDKTGITVKGLARMTGFNELTIKNLTLGKGIRVRTLRRLEKVTRKMHPPIDASMFNKIYGKRKLSVKK